MKLSVADAGRLFSDVARKLDTRDKVLLSAVTALGALTTRAWLRSRKLQTPPTRGTIPPMTLSLQNGSDGPEVGNWQRFLNMHQKRTALTRLVVDECFGMRTHAATISFQNEIGVPDTGVVDTVTRKAALALGFIPFVQAAHCQPLFPSHRATTRLVVIHTMEAQEKPDTASNVAAWFAGPNAPQASAHFCVDDGDTVQCVREGDVAWHAPGVNHDGIGVEHAGYAAQTVPEWDDDYSRAMLERSAQLTADIAWRYNIPIKHLSVDELQRGDSGFIGHIDATNAYSAGKGHTDPGGNFPWDTYLARVKELHDARGLVV